MSAPHPLRQSRASGLPIDEQGYCYLNQTHFDQTLSKIATKLAWRHLPTTLRLLGLPIMTWGLFGLLSFVFIYAGWHDWTFVLYILLVVTAVSLATNTRRMVARVIRDQMCFDCGYQLLGAQRDSAGWGVCSECGRRFNVAEYRRPPRDYQRILWQPRPAKPNYPTVDTGLDWLHPDDEARLHSQPITEAQMNSDER